MRIWKISAGRKSVHWKRFVNDGIAALGAWDEGDLRQYKTREDLREKLNQYSRRERRKGTRSHVEVWNFCNAVEKNELMVLYKKKCICAIGRVTGEYDFNPENRYGREKYFHVLPVEWKELSPPFCDLSDRLIRKLSHPSDALREIKDEECINEIMEMTEEKAYEALKSGDKAFIERVFGGHAGDRQAIVTQRVGQNAIRRYALDRYANQCGLCDIRESEMLVASHIMPWAEDEINRGNPRNVICLCLVHDRLFEKGMLTLLDTYKAEFSERFRASCNESIMLDAWVKNTNEKLRLPSSGEPDPMLLRKHRERFQSCS
ncbi:MAG: HNH endonuclease [Candidatus Bathyarchaeia archaeon]